MGDEIIKDMTEHKIKNPIIPGFYPDPSICKVEDDFYLVCSSFELYPGIPIFHSKDLAHWEQIGYVMTKENGFHTERNSMVGGVMAPTIRYRNGVFYIINTNFCDKGNYIVTSTNPLGPWSEPHWLNDVPGIDASLFFDEDGQAYIIGTGDTWDNGTGVMERGIWLASYDVEHFTMIGEPVTIWNGALRGGASPESPHIYRRGDYYYLLIAEGGTEHHHAVMVARSKELFGWYEGCNANPVLTHRHMGYNSPIINVGHADLIELENGNWYAVFLASRLIDGQYKNMGRETFLCPVIWDRDWPLFSPDTGKVEWEYPADESLPWVEYPKEESLDHFEKDELKMSWNLWGTPFQNVYKIQDSKLIIYCLPGKLAPIIDAVHMDQTIKHQDRNIGFVARRQIFIDFSVTCQMEFFPEQKETAGIIISQSMNHQIRLERICEDGQKLQLVMVTTEFNYPPYIPGFTYTQKEEILASIPYDKPNVIIGFTAKGQDYDFYYGDTKETMQCLITHVDCGTINPERVGCMVGTMIGMFASSNGAESEKYAAFDWFDMEEKLWLL